MWLSRYRNNITSAIFLSGVLMFSLPLPVYSYNQSSYYSQGTYYSQGSYYQQGAYYSGGILAGTQIYTTAGTYQFTVPTGVTAIRYFMIGGGGGGGGGNGGWGSGSGGGCGGAINGGALTVSAGQTYTVVVGSGGAGGAGANVNGATGGVSSFNGIAAAGGSWGRNGYYNLYNNYTGGTGGGSGGGGGGNGWPGYQGYSTSGGSGGANNPQNSQSSGGYCIGNGWAINPGTYITKVTWATGSGGQVPFALQYYGGGGGGGVTINGSLVNGQAGTGGSLVGPGGVGYGGGGGGIGNDYSGTGGAGAPGVVYIEWVSPPTCAVTFDSNPAVYGTGTTLRWTSEYADNGFSINNVGPVSPNTSGSTHVSPSATTNYTGTVWNSLGISGTCPATLTVSAPSAPTATITSSIGSTMNVGQSSTITATFSPGSGDTLTADNIDSPLGTGLGANTNPTTPKTITFTPTAAGTYIFYARATTAYYTSWTTYAQTTVTVNAPCTLGGVTLQSGQSVTFYSQQTASSGQLCSAFAQTRTCTNGVLSGSASYQYASCTCAPIYSCSGNTITYTNATCSVSNTATCVSPAFCSAGSSSCLYPSPSYNTGTSGDGSALSGHLQTSPSIGPLGFVAKIYWNVSNVSSCSVVGTNGDSWTAVASGASGKITAAILERTTFSLSCSGLDGSSVSESKVINVLPIFREL